ncbi:MAG: putative Ig domain-containing protein [Vicinamibacterales bacterium]
MRTGTTLAGERNRGMWLRGQWVAAVAALLLWLAPGVVSAQTLTQPYSANFGSYSKGVVWLQLGATGGTGSYTWSHVGGTLPPGLALRTDVPAWFPPGSQAGVFGVATTAGTYNFTIRATSGASFVDKAYTVKIVDLSINDHWDLPRAHVGKFFSYQFTSTNGTGTWSALYLPPGLTMSSTGLLSGTPTTSGFHSPQVRLNSGSDQVSRTMNLRVEALEITTSPWQVVTPGQPFSVQFAVSGGTAPYTFASGTDVTPYGLTFGPTGTLSGTPSAFGVLYFWVQVTDSLGVSTYKYFNLVSVDAPPPPVSVSTFRAQSCPLGDPCRYQLTTSGGVPPYTYTVTGLPPGMSVQSSASTDLTYPPYAELVGSATQLGVYDAVVTATDSVGNTGSNLFHFEVSELARDFSFGQISAVLGQPYTYQVRIIGGQQPYAASTVPGTGRLPYGLSLDPTTLQITGTPTEAGNSGSVLSSIVDSNGKRFDTWVSAYAYVPGSGTISNFAFDQTLTLGNSRTTTLSACCVPSYYWSLYSGTLPPGLTLLSAGTISGAPTQAGTYVFALKVEDATNPANFSVRTVTYTVLDAVQGSFSITGPTLPYGNVGTAYGPYTFATSGGTPPVTWSLPYYSFLPPGMTFTNGVLSGTPTLSGRFSFYLAATDASGYTVTRFLTADIYPAGVVAPLSLPFSLGTAARGFGSLTFVLSPSGGVPPYHYSTTPGYQEVPGMRVQDGPPLPSGLTSGGAWFGVFGTPGTFTSAIRVVDSIGTVLDKPFTVTVTDLAMVPNLSPPRPVVAAPYSFQLHAYGGSGSYSWSIASGSVLPAGLALDSTGFISGMPLVAGSFSTTLVLTDTVSGVTVNQGLTLNVNPFDIVSGPVLPRATVGVPYVQTLSAPGCGTGCTWSGTFGSGLTLSSAGVLSGTPSTTVNSSFTVTATGSNGTASRLLALQIMPSTPSPLSVLNSTATVYLTIGGTLQTALSGFGGVPPYSWAVRSGSLPTGVSLAGPGEGLGASLAPGFTYVLGRAMVPGTYQATVEVTDSASATATATLTWVVTPLANFQATLPIAATPLRYNQPYSQPLVIGGGAGPYTFATTTTPMPPGLSLSAAGLVTGTPTNTGTFSVPILVTDTNGATLVTNQSFTIAGPTSTVLSFASGAALGVRQLGAIATFTVTPTGGAAPYTVNVVGGLPPGFVLQGSGAGPYTVTGLPQAPGTYSFTIDATDSLGNFGARTFTFTASSTTISVVSTQPDGVVGVPYSQQLTAFDAYGPVTWSLTPGTTSPPGISISTAGVLNGTPTTAGFYSFSVRATDSTGNVITASVNLRVATTGAADPLILPAATVGAPYTYQFHSSGSGVSAVWGAQLPSGFTMSASGLLSGVPTTAGMQVLVISVSDGAGSWSRRFSLPVALPNPAPLSAQLGNSYATVNQLFNLTLSASGGVPPYAWSVASGFALPPGMSLVPGTDLNVSNAPGSVALAGVPTTVGTYPIDLVITDAVGSTITRRLTLVVTPFGLTVSTLPNGTIGTAYSQQLVAVGGTAPYTFSIVTLSPSAASLPPGVTLTSSGLLSGTPTSTGQYFMRLRVQDSQGGFFLRSFSITVTNTQGEAILATNTRVDASAGVGFDEALTTRLGQLVTWSFTTPPPAGVQLSFGQGASASLKGTVAVPGSYPVTVRATSVSNPASVADRTFTINVVPFQIVDPPIVIDFNVWDLPVAGLGQAYSHTLKVAGGTPPYQFALSTATTLPVGVTLSASGVLSGIPQSAGFYNAQVVVTDAAGATAQFPGIRLSVMPAGTPMPLVRTTTEDPLPASVGVPYTFPLDTFILRGGTAPFTWTVDAGASLPPGLVIIPGANGVDAYVGGVPTTPGQFSVPVHVTDATGQVLPTTLNFFVSQIVLSPDAPPTGIVGVPFMLPLTASGGVAPYAVTLMTESDLPPGLTFVNGTISGTPTLAGNFVVLVDVVDGVANQFGKAYIITIDNAAGESPAFSLSPKPIQVYYEAGSPAPQGRVVSVQTTSGAVPYTLSLGGLTGATLTSSGGTSSNTTTLNIDPTGLALGTYVGLLAGSAPGSVNRFDVVPVTLVVAPPPPCSYAAVSTSATFPATSGGSTPLSGSFSVTTAPNCQWTVTSGAPSVVSVSPGAGTGTTTITYTIKDNLGITARNLPVNVLDTASTRVASHVITQFGTACAFSLSPASMGVGAAGGATLVTVTASASACTWTSSSASGLVMTPASGTGTTTVTVTVPPNATALSLTRTATIGGKSLTVNQAGTGCTVGLSPYNGSATAAGGQGSVDVTIPTGCTYDTTSSASWLSILSGATGTASGTVVYSVAPNSTTTPRSASLLVGGQPFVVTQAAQACSFTVATSGLGSPYGPSGATGTIALTANGSNCTWTASSAGAWATVFPASGSGNATIGVTIASNAASTTARNADLTIAGQTVPIVQGGTACSYNLQSTNGSVPAGGGSGSVGVVAPSVCTWSPTSGTPAWLSITASGNAGSSDIQFFAQANTSALARTGSIAVAGLTYTVTQAGAPCGYTLSSTNTNVSKDGASGSFGFSTTASSCTPAALSYAGWITPTTTFNGTTGTVDFVVAPNPLATSRSGLIQLGQQSYLVTQFAASCAYSLSSYGRAFSSVGGPASFLGSPSGLGCTPVVGTNQPSFITLDPLVGPTLNLFTQGFTVSPFNLVGGIVATRTGTITFGGRNFTVKQTSW